MSKKRLTFIAVLLFCMLAITGCAKKCATCGKTIEENEQVKIGNDYYCQDCVEYCTSCKTAYVKGDSALTTFNGKIYCNNCLVKCTSCGTTYLKGDSAIVTINEKPYCKDCVEYCASCNTAYVKGDPTLITINEKSYCKDCVVYCTNCNKACVKDDSSLVTINEKPYCEDCVEYCTGCNTAYVKGDPSLLTYKEHYYCKECFDEVAFPIILEDNENFSMAITSYDDDTGLFAINILNKTDEDISSYDESSPVLDGKKKCVAETDGTHSFAYGDIPANEDVTLFSTFRENGDDGWENILKMSDIHTFEFVMIVCSSGDDFWDDTFKVKLSSDMFGYVK